jgi:hypothetical protein
MKTLEVVISITLHVDDTGDKTYDCLAAIDAAKVLLNQRPGYQLLRDLNATYGQELVEITRLKSVDRGGVMGRDSYPPPLSIKILVE